MRVAVLVAGLVGGLVGAGAGLPAAASPTPPAAVTAGASARVPGPVLLIGTSGVRWSDVSATATPALWRLSRTAGLGETSTRGVHPTGCPADGWLTVSAGAEAAAPRVDGQCGTLGEPVGRAVPGWADDVAAVRSQQFDATPGALGAVLAGSGVAVSGLGPGAAVALADAEGQVVGAHAPVPSSTGELTTAVRAALGSARLVVLDAGAVRDPAAATDQAVRTGPDHAAQLAAVDAAVGAALAATDAGTTVLVVSLTDSGSPDLQLAAASGPAPGGGRYDGGLLTSGATRQVALVQAADVPATVLDALGLRERADALVGATVAPVAGPATADGRLARVLDVQREALAITQVAGGFDAALVVAQVLLLVVAALVLRAGRRPGRPVLRGLRVAATALALLPVSSFLAALLPWWRTTAPGPALGAVALGWATVLSALALAGPWRRNLWGPAAVIGAVTAGVLLADALLGSPLTVDTPMGADRLLGARFYGWSNQAFALATSAGMVLAVVVADALVRRGRRWLAVAAVAALGLVIVVVDGTPGLGSDAGGPVALLLAFGLFAVVVSGRRVRWRTVLLVVGVGVALVGTLMVLDYLRPPAQRTHLGRFVATLLQGGLWTVVARKESANLRVLGDWRYLLLLVGALGVAWAALARRARRGGRRLRDGDLGGLAVGTPLLRPALGAWAAAMVVGFLMNDSGIIVPATGVALVAPALIAAAAQLRSSGQGPGHDGSRVPSAGLRAGDDPRPAG